MRRRAAVACVLLIVGLTAAALTTLNLTRGSGQHDDGAGALSSRNEVGVSELSAVDPAAFPGGSWTFGLRLCRADPSAPPPVLSAVRPHQVVGTGFRHVGTVIRSFDQTADHTRIISVNGFPPPEDLVPDDLVKAEGTMIDEPCHEEYVAPMIEVLVGFERVGNTGGGWSGILVDYKVADDARTLRVDLEWLICGSAVPLCDP
jgi:hypothetical protein